jgi:hypothetical protein
VIPKRSKSQVFRITGARQGLDEDIRGRQRRYVISMSVRTISVILAVVLWNVARPVAVVALVLGFVLPYVAVVIANAGRENAPPSPSTFVPTPSRPKLTAHVHSTGADQPSAPRPQARESGRSGPGEPTQTAADRSASSPQDPV